MRHSIKRISKSALSVILALMMVVSTMVVGIVTTTAAVTTLYVTGDAADGWGNWKELSSKTADNTIAYTTITGKKEFKVSTEKNYNQGYSSLTVDNSSISGTLSESSNLNTSFSGTIYLCVELSTGKLYASQTEPSSGGSTGGGTTYKLMSCADDTGNSTRTEIGTFDENGRLTVTNFESKDYYLYINDSNDQNWFNSSKAFESSNQVKLYDYGTDKFADVIKLSANAGSNYTFTWSVSGSEGVLKYEVTSSSFSLTPSISGSGKVTYTTGGSEITDFTQKFASGTSITVNATPSTGYQLDSIKLNDTSINNGDSFAMPSQDSTVAVTFSLKTPIVTLTPDVKTVNVGESVALTPSVDHELTNTGEYTVTKDGNPVTASDYITDNTFKTPIKADSVGTYVVTYTATVTSGDDTVSASDTSTITVAQSEEQQAYNSLVTWLADSSKNPDNITGKTTSSLNAYKTAYTAAQTAVNAGYPTSGTANTSALSSLQSAYNDLKVKTLLVKPELTALPQYIDLTSDSKTVTLSVSNADSYSGANVTYSFYQKGNGNDTELYTGTNSSRTVDLATEGTFNYYVTINSYDTDNYTCADVTSETKSVIAVTPVTVSVKAGANGKAYVSSYTAYDNQTISNTGTTVTSVKVAPNSSVTFTAVPDEGYVVGVWNTDQSSGSTTYTVANITTATNVTVSFSEKPKYTYALVGNGGAITDSNGNAVDWHGKEASAQADFALAYQAALKFTNNKLVVKVSGITDKNVAQFRFLGTDGTNYYHYGSNDNNNKPVASGSTYTTTQNNMAVFKFTENGTFEIEITSGTDSPMSFKVTKLATYYIGGRFKVKASEGATDYTYTSLNDSTNKWDEKSKVIPFTYVGDGIYKVDTYCTIAELSAQISSTDPYFLIYDGSSMYSNTSSVHKMQDHDSSSPVTLTKITDTGTGNLLLFSDKSSTDTSLITLYLDTTGSSKKLYYVAEGGKTALDAPSITKDIETLTVKNPTATITVTPADTYPKGMAVKYYLYNGGTYVDYTTGTTFTVSSAGTYTVKAYPPADNPDYKESVDSNSVVISDGRTPVVLEAMHGIKNGEVYTGNTVAEAANTSSSVVENTSANLAGGKEYKVTKGSTVKVITTMVADTTTAEKFVYAYVVNNKDTYLATEGIAATGEGDKKYATYSATFTIAEDTTDTTFTVVPIYYYKACGKDGEYIKFYVDNKDSDWTTVNNYAYYYDSTGTKNENTKESDGVWPGQQMLYDETKQLYYALVPKAINGQAVSGLTVNNGSGSVQTYDYDDFKIINEIGYDIVRLDLKQRDYAQPNKTTLGADYTDGSFKSTTTPTVSTFADRWEAYKDINGHDISLLGKAVTDTTNKVYVVSTALYSISGRGQYMTSWYVYKSDSSGNLTFVTAACPSDFIPRLVGDGENETSVNTAAYNAVLAAGLDKAAVEIVYEEYQDPRLDGRWYYAQSDSEVSAYAYYRTTDSDGTNPSELFQNAAYASVNGAVSVTNPKLGLEVSVVSSPLAGYIFDYWSVVDKAGNILIKELDNVGASFTTTLDQEVRYVANFRKATSGQLVINHSKYTGTDAKNGLGFYRLEVKVQKEDGSWTSVYAGSGTGANGQTVTISELTEKDKIVRIKLITETAGENTFRYWYTTSSDGTEIIEDPDGDMTCNGSATSEPYGKNGILTYTFDTDVWKLFRDGEQKVTQLNFYSDISPMTKNYKLTYIYDDRFGNQKTYVVTGTHDDQYFVENKSWAPTQALIYEKAPYIDDLYKDCTWTMTQCTKDGTDAKLIAVQKGKSYKVDIFNASGASESHTLPINSYVKNKAGQFYVAADTYNEQSFSYWAVYERLVNANGDPYEGKEVARHFYTKYTLVVLDNYIIKPIYGATKEDKTYISDPQYTREQSTNEDGKEPTDTLYVDFMLAYMSSTGALINSDPTKYKTGVLVELGQNYVLPVDDKGNVTNTNYSAYAFTENSTKEKLTEATNLENGKSLVYNYGDTAKKDYRRIYNFTANSSDYNNMNRLDYFVAFKNSPANRRYVMKAYYYVIVGDKVIISEPVCFNLYEVGTSTVS